MGCTHFEPDRAVDSLSGIVSQTTDSTTCEHGGGTLSETKNVSTVMQSAGNSGVWTQHVVNDVIITSWQAESSSQPMQCEAAARLADVNEISNPTSECVPEAQPSNGGSQMKPDTLQPARCELCNISCTSNEGLSVHLTGKKHLKKLLESDQIPDPSLTPIASLGTPPTKPMENLESTEGKSVISHEGKPAWCELCGIDCNTYDGLRNHIWGKKHQKKLEISEKPIGPNPAPATLQDSWKEEGKVVNVDGGNRKAKRVGNDEDLETKKQKVLKGGAASGAVRTCTVCNVVCNSPTVFISHLAGQKHAAMAVKQAETKSNGQET
ncbi:zinc finger matrin-type protein 3-like isoform X2 [Cynara cardunculus var. scolymus]|uniref:zinc finger matrin-type protein 3-like isoform X2 n=1 Tax=Cynara cardunculus var. scolymus TaxID=59895 RepID=UPI000D627E71|nr:zinc finger matrin-type protein 3-like isoform X2 [Cynara cardunculus var. scolymus]